MAAVPTQLTDRSGWTKLQKNRKILGLVVHGVGEQTVGSTLHCVVKEFFPLIRNTIDSKWAGISAVPVDEPRLPEVHLSFHKPSLGSLGSYDRYEILVREVNWAKAFIPPDVSAVVGGLWSLLQAWIPRIKGIPKSGPGQGLWLGSKILLRLLSDMLVVALMIVLSPVALAIALLALVGGLSGWSNRLPRPLSTFLSLYAKFQPSVVELAVIVLFPAAVLLFLALVVLERIGPLAALLPDSIGKARGKIVTIVTSHLGDVSAYACQPWEASQIRTRFEDRFKKLVEEDNALPGDQQANVMFVIAHSLGCPVSYEALSGTQMKQFIRTNFDELGRRLYYFTVGSALPAIWAVLPMSEKSRLYRKLPRGVHWEDFIATYDPVQSALICRSVAAPAGVSQMTKPSHLVVNQMDVLSDHTAYWNNVEEVLKPILDLITADPAPPTPKQMEKRREASIRENRRRQNFIVEEGSES